ncbi:MAG: pyruvate kinase [Butyrivibrio sp.]|nr:pyruvate kinase [Butyrivibrio sp.]
MVDILGTLGPSCDNEETLSAMFAEGMTGIRINLSHVMLIDCADKLQRIQRAAKANGVSPKILIDMQGPEVRIGNISETELPEGSSFTLGKNGIPVDEIVLRSLKKEQEILLDDGKILAKVIEVAKDGSNAELRVIRGGRLTGRKSLAIVGKNIDCPAMTGSDLENLKIAVECGVTAVMQPFVRSADDLKEVRRALDENNGTGIEIYAKIENMAGVENLTSFFPYADEIVIARGDLGNAMPLWELPKVQKEIAKACNAAHKRFMVVTQMLSSMERSKVPTRAEVSDIYNAVFDGANSVMVTGETAIGENPVDVIRYLKKTATIAYDFCVRNK